MNVRLPIRVERSYTQHIQAAPERVFPLLCPVREADWVNEWEPTVVFSASGVAEQDCVFVTPDAPDDAVWIVTDYDPEDFTIAFVKVVPRRLASRIVIALVANEEGGTDAYVTYMHTALSEEGEADVQAFTEAYYAAFMQQWEAELNHYLRTGRKLDA